MQGVGLGGGVGVGLFWLIKTLFSEPGLSFTKKYITLLYVKYADLLGNATLFRFVHFNAIEFFEGFLVSTDKASR